MGKNYKIEYKFQSKRLNSDIKELALKYWESRNFKCQLKPHSLIGKRGSIYGNLTSYNMSKLICDLQVEFINDNFINVVFIVNGKFQDIVETNLWDFKLEQIFFQRGLNKLPMPDFLSDYLKYRKKSALIWTFSLMLKGRNIPQDLMGKLERLTDGEKLPTVEIL